jgi:formamidopyrimidine-DNA glycosylase
MGVDVRCCANGVLFQKVPVQKFPSPHSTKSLATRSYTTVKLQSMPELPEVNTFQRYFDAAALQQRIQQVVVHDEKIIRNMNGDAFAEHLQGRTFTGSYRRGKYLFGELDNGAYVQFHFGMTGDLNYYQDGEQPSRFERFVFVFDNGYRLGFDDPRKFARILYLEDLQAYLQSIALGEDALIIDEATFLDLMQGKKGNLKAFLLNQKYLAGVGNLYADEICYQARIHPASLVEKLDLPQRKLIYDLMQKILQSAMEQSAHYKEYPENWFWQWREEGYPAPDGSGEVEKATIAGRTTYFCAGWQKMYS